MTSAISLIVNVDRLAPAKPDTSTHEGVTTVWMHFEDFALYGRDASALRRLAATVTEAAAVLDAKATKTEGQ